jgi:hypothetical protein
MRAVIQIPDVFAVHADSHAQTGAIPGVRGDHMGVVCEEGEQGNPAGRSSERAD